MDYEKQIGGAVEAATAFRADLLRVGRDFSVRAAGEILDGIDHVLAKWRDYAARTAVPEEGVRVVESALRERSDVLAG